MKWDLNLVHELSPAGLECHFLVSLPKMLEFVIITRPMSIRCMSVAAVPEASVMHRWKLPGNYHKERVRVNYHYFVVTENG